MSDVSTDIWGEPTNVAEDIVSDEEFMEDTPSDETDNSEDTENEEVTEEENTEDTSDNDEKEETFTFTKKGGEDATLSRSELKDWVEKGFDYDRVKQERDDYRESLSILTQLAKENGMQVKEYLAEVQKNVDNSKIEGIAKELIENGTDEETAYKMAELQFERDRATARLNGIENARAEQENLQARAQEMYEADVSRLKEQGVEVNDELLVSLKDYIDKGLTLVEAYKEKEIADLKKQLETQQLHAESKQRSAGSAKSQKAIKADDDIINALMDA